MVNTFAVIGASGAVGAEMLSLLRRAGRAAPIVYGSERSRGDVLPYGDGELRVRALEVDGIPEVRVALFAANGDVAREWAPRFVERGVAVVDNSSAFRLTSGVPLVVPEVNAAAIPREPAIIANPNCSTIILLLALAPLRELGRFSVDCATYQAVSGAGRDGLAALDRETRDGEFRVGEPFPYPIGGNVFPVIGDVVVDALGAATQEERKMVLESRKILGLPKLEMFTTCVRVPIERCHSEAVTLRFDRDVDVERAAALLRAAPGLSFSEDPLRPPMPATISGGFATGVGRLRQPAPHVLQLWVVGDQLLKGAALNAYQIAERYLDG